MQLKPFPVMLTPGFMTIIKLINNKTGSNAGNQSFLKVCKMTRKIQIIPFGIKPHLSLLPVLIVKNTNQKINVERN